MATVYYDTKKEQVENNVREYIDRKVDENRGVIHYVFADGVSIDQEDTGFNFDNAKVVTILSRTFLVGILAEQIDAKLTYLHNNFHDMDAIDIRRALIHQM